MFVQEVEGALPIDAVAASEEFDLGAIGQAELGIEKPTLAYSWATQASRPTCRRISRFAESMWHKHLRTGMSPEQG
jgi:hypothetical protein